ncbi:hypothetical protein [Erysipelothrix aquatica]|uniref:hypothetical protein n=1 Tax=Erysipelothrix aquatica TaxID=2683714 RepID=UPI00135A91E0|nr:hypothetical protein [Erysipelothrix aquatica]
MIRNYITNNKYKFFGFFAFFLLVNLVIDNLNISYSEMQSQYSLGLVMTNIILNILMAGISAYLMMISSLQFSIIGKESKSQNFSFVSIIFGILTYGCTPCVVAFFASFGVAFSVYALPLANLPYKIISLGILALGIWFTHRELNKTCKIG